MNFWDFADKQLGRLYQFVSDNSEGLAFWLLYALTLVFSFVLILMMLLGD